MTPEELRRRLDALLGVESEPRVARDPVNAPMIRHWCDAVGDRNPVYTDPERAGKSVHGGLVAPPTMLQAWTMVGLAPPEERPRHGSALWDAVRLLDEAGYTSVVATNCRQEYRRYLRPDDRLRVTSRLASVSDEKQTALGPGRFVDEVMTFRDQHGEEVARMNWRVLKFRPPGSGTLRSGEDAPRRPRPARSADNAFFWEGIAEGRLRIQRCADCRALRHPPGPMCPDCHSLDWDTVDASGRGRVYSFVVVHHPPLPAFESPNPIVLVELEEGVRLVSNLLGVAPTDLRIGQPVELAITRVDPELVLPLFRPVPEN